MASLIVVVVLLGIVSALTLYSLSYGMRDRRAISDEAAAHVAQDAAQVGLDQALQYFRAHASDALSAWLRDSARWQRCDGADTTVPCGAVPAAVRANYLRAPAALDMRDTFVDAAGAPARQIAEKAGDQPIRYDVFALLCLINTVQPEQQCVSSTAADTSAGAYHGRYAITLISHAQLVTAADAEKAPREAVVKETIATRTLGESGSALSVVPGSWSDAGRIDAHGAYAER
jgi:type II secretory pathway pseudopilin PulG